MKAIWPKSSPKLVANTLSGHSALGLAIGALIYILCLSGTLAVFYPDSERWEQPATPEMSEASPAAVQRLAEQRLAQLDKPPANIFIYLPNPDRPRLTIWSGGEDVMTADASGTIIGKEQHDFTHFLLNLHIYFHLPSVIGLTVVGLMGAMLAGLIISGFLAHPRIFRDAFTFRLGGSKRLSEADLHNRLSVWGAPFHIIIAVTGAVLGLSSIMALLVATLAYGGDTTKVFGPIFGSDAPVADKRPAPLPNIARAVTTMREARPDTPMNFVRVSNPGTDKQQVEINVIPQKRLVYAEIYKLTTAGDIIGPFSIENGPAGRTMFAASYPLHFGNFGGWPIRMVYGLLGAALCVICATGVNIWLVKRREKNRPAPRLERAWIGVVWGTPLSLAVCLLASLFGVGEDPLAAVFWTGLVAVIAAAVGARGNRTISRTIRIATGGLLLAGVVTHAAKAGEALLSPAALGVSVGLTALAVATIASALGVKQRRSAPVIAPAE